MSTMTYRGYTAQITYDDDTSLFTGEVIDLRDIIVFTGESVDDLRKGMSEAVDGYIAWCAEEGQEPEKPFSGNIRLRLSADLHRAAAIAAADRGESLNQFLVGAVEGAISKV